MKGEEVEVELCESVSGASHDQTSKALYHVEIRYIPSKGGHSVVFRGQSHKDKKVALAELAQAERLATRAWQLEST